MIAGPVGKTALTPKGLPVPALQSVAEERLDLLLQDMTRSQLDVDLRKEAEAAEEAACLVLARREADKAGGEAQDHKAVYISTPH